MRATTKNLNYYGIFSVKYLLPTVLHIIHIEEVGDDIA